MDSELTFLERGIFVTITKDEWHRFLKSPLNGCLERKNYPELYEEIAEQNEIGRFMCFRFLLDEENDG